MTQADLRERGATRTFVVLFSLLWLVYGALYLWVLSFERPVEARPETFFLTIGWIEAALMTPWIVRRVGRHRLWGPEAADSVRRHVSFGVVWVLIQVTANNVAMWWVTGHLMLGNLSLPAAIAIKIPTSIVFGASMYAFTVLIAALALASNWWSSEVGRKLVLDRDAARLELDLFRTRVDPALINATLRRVEDEIDTDVGRAEEATHELADFLRATLDRSLRSTAAIGEELVLLRHYLALMAFNSGVRLGDVRRRGEDVSVPAGLLNASLASMKPLVTGDIDADVQASTRSGLVRLTVTLSGLDIAVEKRLMHVGEALEVEVRCLAQPLQADVRRSRR